MGFGKAEGNRGRGRPKGSSYLVICQEYMAEKGFAGWFSLADKMLDDEASVGEKNLGLFASKLIAAYAFGKPRQQVDVTTNSATALDAIAGMLRLRSSKAEGIHQSDSNGPETVGEADIQH